jgi:TrmH family RNA methyltransferase
MVRLDQFVVVVDNPLYPINLGYIARVMANLGFGHLRLTRPRAAIDEWAVSMAMEGRAILESAIAYDRFEDALQDCALAIATTRRVGRRKITFMVPQAAAQALAGLETDGRVAIVFGSEDNGLTNEQVQRCDWVVYIPGEPGRDSFNLSHAVAIVLYEIRYALEGLPRADRVRAQAIEGFLRHARIVLEGTGFLAADDPLRAIAKLRALLYRARPNVRELGVLHAIFDHMAVLGGLKPRMPSPQTPDRPSEDSRPSPRMRDPG